MYRQLVRLWCGLVELRFVFAVERGSCFFAVFDPDCLPGLSFSSACWAPVLGPCGESRVTVLMFEI